MGRTVYEGKLVGPQCCVLSEASAMPMGRFKTGVIFWSSIKLGQGGRPLNPNVNQSEGRAAPEARVILDKVPSSSKAIPKKD